VPDPSPAQAAVAIAENTVGSSERVSQLNHDYVMVPTYDLGDPEENWRKLRSFRDSEACQKLLDKMTEALAGIAPILPTIASGDPSEWGPGPFPGTVMQRADAGTAIFPDDPAYIARVLRGEL